MIPFYKENIFKILTEDEMNMLVAKSEYKKIKKGELIVRQGFTFNRLIYILEGQVKVGKKLDSNQIIIGGIVHAKNFIDFKALFDNSKYSECVEAINDTVVLIIPSDLMFHLIDSNFRFKQMIHEQISKHLNRLENWIYNMHPTRSRNDKIINFLILMAIQSGYKIGTDTVVKINITQTEIAAIIGTSRQSVSEVMNDLRRERIIDYTREKMIIRNFKKLQEQLQHQFLKI